MHSERATNDNQRNIGQRLRTEMKKRGLSSVELAKRADVKTSFLYDVISGKSANPSSIKLARVAESLGVSLTYLAGTSDSPVDGYQFSLPSQESGAVIVPRLLLEQGTLAVREDSREPYQFHREWIKKKIGAPASALRLLTMQDDSMHPTLCQGDAILVDTTKRHPSPPGIFLLFDGGSLLVKRLELVPHPNAAKLRVMCDNSHYSTYETTPDATEILGRVVWFSREM